MSGFWDLLAVLRGGRFVDLTHAFDESIPAFEGFPPMVVEDVESLKPYGIWSQTVTHVGQYGTHADPPIHLAPDADVRYLDQIDVSEMLLPLCVIDQHEAAAANPDTMLTVEDISMWEAQHGRIPAGAFVAVRTDWYKHFGDADTFFGCDADGATHWPGITLDALKLLLHERGVTAIGHETLGTDGGYPSYQATFPVQKYLHAQNFWQIEVMANLDQCPPTGALIVASWPKMKRGSGFPARAFAIVPPDEKPSE